jgi:hypothetical protein
MDTLELTIAEYGDEGYLVEAVLRQNILRGFRKTLDDLEATRAQRANSGSQLIWIFAEDLDDRKITGYALVKVSTAAGSDVSSAGYVLALETVNYDEMPILKKLKETADLIIWKQTAINNRELLGLQANY